MHGAGGTAAWSQCDPGPPERAFGAERVSRHVLTMGARAAAVNHLHFRTGGIATAAAARAWLRIGPASTGDGHGGLVAAALVNSAPPKVGVGVVAGVTVYLGGAKILGVRELSMLLRPRRAPS